MRACCLPCLRMAYVRKAECAESCHWGVQRRTVPYLESNPEVGFVQTRWTFANADESYLTKAQEISLNYHFKCEQFVHFATDCFFNFNGTAGAPAHCRRHLMSVPSLVALLPSGNAVYLSKFYFDHWSLALQGVWRSKTITSVGGWNSRTTVEDMDLSLRSYYNGWKSIFLEDVTVVSEVRSRRRSSCSPAKVSPVIVSHVASSALKAGGVTNAWGCGAAARQLLCVPQAAAPMDVRPRPALAQGGSRLVGQQAPAVEEAGAVALLLCYPQVCHPLGLSRLLLHAGPPLRVQP